VPQRPGDLIHLLNQSQLCPPRTTRLSRQAWAAWLLCLLMASVSASAQGRFEVRSAGARQIEGVYYIDARVDYRLSDKALEALQNGLQLNIQLQVEVIRKRAFLPDARVAELSQNALLSYQPLSQRYLVKSENSGEQSSYATLFSALNSIGRVQQLPVIDVALLDPEATYRMRVRSVLDQDTLPGPLRLLAFWSEGFRLASDWYGWTLKD